MFRTITENLDRQLKAVQLMEILLTEEFAYMKGADPQAVTALEMSLQELIRQVAVERVEVKRILAADGTVGANLTAYADTLNASGRSVVLGLLEAIDEAEQASARQAEKNHRMALALYEQNRALIDFMQGELNPQRRDIYSKKGKFARSASQGTIIRGRL